MLVLLFGSILMWRVFFSKYLVDVSMTAFMNSAVTLSIPPLLPFFSFFIALTISSFRIGPVSIFATAVHFSSISSGYAGCGRFSTSSKWSFHLFLLSSWLLRPCRLSFTLFSLHNTLITSYTVLMWPLLAALSMCLGHHVFCPLFLVIQHIAFDVSVLVTVLTSQISLYLLTFGYLLFQMFSF